MLASVVSELPVSLSSSSLFSAKCLAVAATFRYGVMGWPLSVSP